MCKARRQCSLHMGDRGYNEDNRRDPELLVQ